MLVALLFWTVLASSSNLTPIGIDAAFDAAIHRSETIEIQSELTVQGHEKVRQAWGSILPNVSFIGAYQRQQDTTSSSSTSSVTKPDQTTLRIALAQRLFNGMREYAALNVARHGEAASESDRKRALMLLYNDVVDSVSSVNSLEADLLNLNELIRLTAERKSELSERRRIGRSRESEVVSVDAQLKLLNSQKASLEGQLRVTRETFAFLTGLSADSSLLDSSAQNLELLPLKSYIDSIESRADLEAASRRVELAESSVNVSKGGHLPTLDLGADYYLKRPGFLENVKWDVQLTLSVPLFSGGVTWFQTNEAVSRLKQSELELQRMRRNSELEVKQAYLNVSSLDEQIRAHKEALSSTEKNYKIQNSEYRLGLVTNLDVLQALNTFHETKRDMDRLLHQRAQGLLKLRNLAGLRSYSQTDFGSHKTQNQE